MNLVIATCCIPLLALLWGRKIRGCLSVSKTDDLLGFLPTASPRIYREWTKKKTKKDFSDQQFCGWEFFVDEKECRRMVRVIQADRKVQITTIYNRDRLNSINRTNLEADRLQQKKATPVANPVI